MARGRRLATLGGAVAVAAVAAVLAVVALWGPGPGPGHGPGPDGRAPATQPIAPTTAPPTVALTAVGPPAAVRVWPDAREPERWCPEIGVEPGADVDGDGCAEAVRLEGGTVRAGGARFEVGQPGEVAAAGDWDCDGTATVALLRPATGEVFVFDGWAVAGEDLPARLLGRVPGAAGIRRQAGVSGGCDVLVVTRADGKPEVVPWAPAG